MRRVHYAWVVAGLAFTTMLVGSGIRSTPGVLMTPMERDMGWSAATISAAIGISIALSGLMGPLTASLMQSIGIRRTILIGLGLCAISAAFTSLITTPFELVITWGFGVGLGTGLMGMVVAATVAARWFVARRGTVVGLLTAANATGQLVFLPILALIAQRYGWRPLGLVIAGLAIAVSIPVALFMRERPAAMGLLAYGATGNEPAAAVNTQNPLARALSVLHVASRKRDFWILFGSFFICGASTVGLIGTHFIPACTDHGIPEVQAAGYLAMIGAFDLIGTTGAGWLTDRWNPRYLLFWFYSLRGLSLFFVPYAFGIGGLLGLPLFAMFFGLDFVATVPPTVRLTLDVFGPEDGPIVFGWIGAGHQLGAAAIVVLVGLIRTAQGSYDQAFILSASVCLVAALAVLGIGVGTYRAAPAPAA